jgi:hypothetical protein
MFEVKKTDIIHVHSYLTTNINVLDITCPLYHLKLYLKGIWIIIFISFEITLFFHLNELILFNLIS